MSVKFGSKYHIRWMAEHKKGCDMEIALDDKDLYYEKRMCELKKMSKRLLDAQDGEIVRLNTELDQCDDKQRAYHNTVIYQENEIVRLNAEVDRLNKSVEQAIEQIEDGLGEWASIETVMQSNRNIPFKNALDILRETIPTLDNAQECE